MPGPAHLCPNEKLHSGQTTQSFDGFARASPGRPVLLEATSPASARRTGAPDVARRGGSEADRSLSLGLVEPAILGRLLERGEPRIVAPGKLLPTSGEIEAQSGVSTPRS